MANGNVCFRKSEYNKYIENWSFDSDVTSIGKDAFAKCFHLKSIHIPASVKKIHDGAFFGCANLESITVSEDNKYFSTSDDHKVLFADKGKTVVFCSPTLDENCYVIPQKVKKIGYGAFYGTRFEKIIIPETVITIEDRAFEFCENLNNIVVIPNSVVTIGKDAFSMSSVEGMVIGDGVKTIGDRAFAGCFCLKNLVIGASLQEIGDNVFDGCRKLKNIKVDPRNETFTSTNLTLSKKDGSMMIVPSMSDFEMFNNVEKELKSVKK